MHLRNLWVLLGIITLASAATGCSSSGGGTAPRSPDNYEPPQQAIHRAQVAVPEVAIGSVVGIPADVDLPAVASDEMLSLLQSSNRFDLTERQRFRQIVAEQNAPDTIVAGRIAHPRQLQGLDLVFLGRIAGLSVRKEPPAPKSTSTGLMQWMHIEKVIPRLIVDGVIELDLAEVKTGAVLVSKEDNVHFVATPKELGLQMTDDQLKDATEVQLTSNDTRVILRYVIDKPLRFMLPRIDHVMVPPPGPPTTQGDPPPPPPPGALLTCPECGHTLTGREEFCPNCHKKLK